MEYTYTVKQNDSHERLDKWLTKQMPETSRNQIKALLDDGRILVNQKRVLIASWELEAGDEVEVRVPQPFEKPHLKFQEQRPAESKFRTQITGHEKPHVSASIDRHLKRQHVKAHSPKKETHSKHLHVKIYHEDRDVIVVEKPAGIVAVSEKGKSTSGDDMLSHIRSYLKRRHQSSGGSFVAPLHRLDAETSGVMVFALSRAGQNLERQFRDHSIRREYTAVVEGSISEENGVIDIPLEKGDFHGGKKVRPAKGTEGRRAITEFRVKERYKNATLLNVTVRTGRTHQIRVHLAEKGFPLLGDKLYSGGNASFSRHMLHAHLLGFRHPTTGKKFTFHSPLPSDMHELIENLRSFSC